ncbi:MAG: hypothetical protein IT330_06340 [Anaerolineae bacterium]|nr:hypothetical protein [Anaerolineae bacterium]
MSSQQNPHSPSGLSDHRPTMLPRTVQRATRLVHDAKSACVIVYPSSDPSFAEIAQTLAAAIERSTGVGPLLATNASILPGRGTPLPDSYRCRPLILLGNINTNRLLLPLYARYYCATDVAYPGGDGYDLRTLVNPYGTNVNYILAGGSTLRGVQRATERLIGYVNREGQHGELDLPFLLDVELEPTLARQLAEWPDTRLGRPLPQANADLLIAVGNYAILYAWTGDARYAEFACACLREMNSRVIHSYGDWHYLIERVVRAMLWLTAGGFLDEADVLRTDELIFGTTYETQDMWWRKRDGKPPLGHRHQGKGTFMFYQQARYLREQANPNAEAARLCDRWLSECREFMDALARARADDQDDDTSLNNLTTLVGYALGEERFEFFESGNARLCAERAIAVHDNMGAGAGLAGYGEGLSGAMYYQEEAWILTAAAALYYQDGELKSAWEQLRLLRNPLKYIYWSLSPVFMHKYDPGPEVAAKPPHRLLGLRRLPLSAYQIGITTRPPEHIEPMGHNVDKPETWMLQGGLGPNRLPAGRTFDKIVLRKSFAPHDPYLLLQGYNQPYRWQGALHATNAIVRFSQGGHIFLIQNSDRQSYYHKNAILISDGYNNTPLPTLAEWLSADDFPTAALSATRVNDAHHTDWTRYLFWSKVGDGFFVVMDAVETKQQGPYACTCTWRTPGYAELNGRFWRARQGEHLFTLCASRMLPMTNEEQGPSGASNPYVLRQRQEGEYAAGTVISFQNLLHVGPEATPRALDLQYLGPTQALVIEGEKQVVAWCAVDPKGEGIQGAGLEVQATSIMVTPERVFVSGTRDVRLVGDTGWHFVSDRPVGLLLDLAGRQAMVQGDSPDSAGARVELRLRSEILKAEIQGEGVHTFSLPAAGCDAIMTLLRESLAALLNNVSAPEPGASPSLPAGTWREGWQFTGWQTLVQERLRDVTVAAQPAPADGFPEQLTDTMLPDAVRQLARQWPVASQYDIRLELGKETVVDHLCIVGDSRDQPTLRAYHPLPQGITVAVSADGFNKDRRPCAGEQEAGILSYERYHRWEDHFDTLRIPIQARARQIHVRIPAPSSGEPLVCHELEVYGHRRTSPPLRLMISEDLDGDGRLEIVAVSMADEVVALDAEGIVRWRWQSPKRITHLSCHDLDGDGRKQVCVGILGNDLVILNPDGSVRRATSYGPLFQEVKDIALGMLWSINSISVWHREPDGRAALVIGAYAVLVFLDPDGQILGHSFIDGSWVTDFLTSPAGGPGPWDLWARTRWNHGITVYEGLPGLRPSGGVFVLGGVHQPMFRKARRVIPFVTGHTVTFDWVRRGRTKNDGLILAAAEHGVGVLSPAQEDWLWTVEGGTYIQSCIAADVDGDGETEVIVGGADGFVAAFGLWDGRPKGRLPVGAPVTGLAAWPSSNLWLVGTRDRLLTLDANWQIMGARQMSVHRLGMLDAESVVISVPDGRLARLTWDDARSG